MAAIRASGSTTLCNGSSVILTADGGDKYLWSSAETTASISVSAAGNYKVTVSNNCGTDTISKNIFISNTAPVAVITASGSTAICQGNSVTLTASGGDNYLWSNAETTANISVSTNGNYKVTVSNNCGSDTVSENIIVHPLPVAVITASGSTTICQGNSVTLTASGGDNYLWSTTETTANITVSTAGNYRVTASNDCGSDTISVNIIVNPLPVVAITASGSTTICDGNTVLLTATAASDYLWNYGQTTQSITVSAVGGYFVKIKDANDCAATSATTAVSNSSVRANIVANTDVLCDGSSIELTAVGGSDFLWASGESVANISVSEVGNYKVTVSNDCGSDTTSITITDCTDTITGILFVPNIFSPNGDGANDTLFAYSLNVKKITGEIYNRWGNKVFEWKEPKSGWDGKDAPAGVYAYFVSIEWIDEKTRTVKGMLTLVR